MAAAAQVEPAAELSAEDSIVVAGRFQVGLSARRPDLDSPTAEAYLAEDLRDHGNAIYALVCGNEPPPRLAELEALTGKSMPGLQAPLGWAVAFWPPANAEQFVIVFHQPMGDRLMAVGEHTTTPMKDEQLVRVVIKPLLPVLEEFSRKSLTHRAIRLDNLFFADPARSSVKLGECVSTPPGFAQPAIYETIDRGLAEPAGRGTGTIKDDLYAFGVMLMALILGHDLREGVDEKELIETKIGTGSYAALLGRERIPITLLEPLRGLLCDNPDDRWTVEDLARWIDGRALSPKQVMLPTKAQRSFKFADGEYLNLRTLANAMSRNWIGAIEMIQGRQLLQWVQRSLSNDPRAPFVEHAFSMAQDGGRTSRSRDQILFRMLLAIDPEGPFRYKQIICSVDALGYVLASHFDEPEIRSLFRDIFLNKLPQVWMESQPKSLREHNALKRDFNRLNNFVGRKGPAFGLERCLYHLNPGWPCKSPLLRGKLVHNLAGLLPALELIAEQEPGELEPVDTHIAAFCAANMRLVNDRVLKGLDEDNNSDSRRLAMLGLLAEVQDSAGPDSLPALAAWFVALLKPVIDAIHSVPYKTALDQEIERTVQDGALKELLALVDNRPARQRDKVGFAQARVLYRQAESEVEWLEAGGLTNAANVTRGSEQASVLVSGALSGLALVVITLLKVI